MLVPVNFDGTCNPIALTKIRADYRVYHPNAKTDGRKTLVFCGFEQMTPTAKFIFNVATGDFIFKQTSVLDTLVTNGTPDSVLQAKTLRADKGILMRAAHFDPTRIEEKVEDFFTEAVQNRVIIVGHRLVIDTIQIEYQNRHKKTELSRLILGVGDTIFLHNGTIDARIFYGPGKPTPHGRFRGDHID